MKILIDILHPAHVHFFRNFIHEMGAEGHVITITARDKEMTLYLLEKYDLPYELISRQQTGLRLGIELLTRTFRLWRVALRVKPDCLMGIMGPSISIVGFLMRIPTYIFYDTEHAKITNRYAFRLADKVITPDCYLDDLGTKGVRYKGYHELAYLSKRYFTPNEAIYDKYHLDRSQRIFLMRFISWGASHDLGHAGLSFQMKKRLVEYLSDNGQLVITSEGKLPEEFSRYQMNFPPEEIHDLLRVCDIYVGEGATMASEAALLGTYAVYINSLTAGTIKDQEKHGLLKHFDPKRTADSEEAVFSYVRELVEQEGLKQKALALSDKLLREKVDVTSWMKQFVADNVGISENQT